MKTDKCPACGVTWLGKDIADTFESNGHSRAKAEEIADFYGWSLENRLRFQVNMIGIETGGYDGVTYWQCMTCGKTFNRWTGEEQ